MFGRKSSQAKLSLELLVSLKSVSLSNALVEDRSNQQILRRVFEVDELDDLSSIADRFQQRRS